VIVSKLGLFEATPQAAAKVHGALSIGPNLAYCLEPDWLDQALHQSLDRLNVSALDVCLVHSPELLIAAAGAERGWQALGRAFEWLEVQVERGLIGRYGVSSNELVLDAKTSEVPTLADLERTLAQHGARHFNVLELPLNPLEARPWDSGVIARAHAKGWAVLTQRTLSAVVGDELWRLADAPEDPDAPSLEEALDAVQHAESEFRSRLGAVLSAATDAGKGDANAISELLDWGRRVTPKQVVSRAVWNDFERAVLAPEITHTLNALDRAFAGKQLGNVWRDFRRRYTQQIEHLLLAARAHSGSNSNRKLAAVSSKLAALPGLPARATLAQRAAWSMSSLDGVSAALVGMRRPSQVQDALATLSWPALESAAAAFLDPAMLGALSRESE
jgi:aryl-alcohol dehydrogenase-like predicted oxidoreductase